MTLEALEPDIGLSSASSFNNAVRSNRRIAIRLAATADELNAIYRFRYTIYRQEASSIQVYADAAKQIIQDPFDKSAFNFAAFRHDEVVGAVRVNFSRNSDLAYYEDFLDMQSAGLYHPSATSICTRLIVTPQLRGSPLALRLAEASYRIGVCHQIKYNFLDCDHRMTRFFERLGYVRQGCAEHPEYGLGNIMRLNLLDRANLVRNQSPFLKILDLWLGIPTAAPMSQ